MTNLERLQLSITKKEMYHEDDALVRAVVKDMITLPIQHVGEYINLMFNIHISPRFNPGTADRQKRVTFCGAP